MYTLMPERKERSASSAVRSLLLYSISHDITTLLLRRTTSQSAGATPVSPTVFSACSRWESVIDVTSRRDRHHKRKSKSFRLLRARRMRTLAETQKISRRRKVAKGGQGT